MPSRSKIIGLILECSKDGPDEKVCQYAAGRIAPSMESSTATMDNRPKLLENCGKAARQMLSDGCAHVFIIWDLIPSTHGKREKPCMKEDREKAMQSLKSSNADPARITLICIVKELETWLIADHRAMNKVVREKKSHKNAISNPEHESNPKKRLNRIFKAKLGRPYVGHRDALEIAKEIPDCRYVGNSRSFQRFSEKLKELENQENESKGAKRKKEPAYRAGR